MATHAKTVLLMVGSAKQNTPCHVEIDIDMEALFRYLGQRAIRNRSKKTVEMSGIVKARANVIKQV